MSMPSCTERDVELREITLRYEKRESPVTISSDRPSASAVRSALAPLYLNGSTATQNPSSERSAPEPSAAVGCVPVDVGAGGGSARRAMSRISLPISRGLDAIARLFFQASTDDAR